MSNYVIIPTTELTEVHIENCDQDALHTVRKSVDGKLAIVSYQGNKPAVFTRYRELTAQKALKRMQSWQWDYSRKKPWWVFLIFWK